MPQGELRFAYRAVSADGKTVSAQIRAPNRGSALRQLSQSNLTVTSLREAGGLEPSRWRWGARRAGAVERALVLKQLAVMVRAGVELLEALETVRTGLPEGETRNGVAEAAAALRRGDKVAKAIGEAMPGYPLYVTALIGAGEASGQLDRVLEEASAQLTAEARNRREIRSALIYPAFLIGAGFLVITFLFSVVVPRFAAMIGPQRDRVEGLPNFVLTMGETVQAQGMLILGALLLLIFGGYAAMNNPAGRQRIISVAARIPGIGRLVAARQRAVWTRIMSFALSAGVGLLEAMSLASASIPEGRFKATLGGAVRDIRAGKPVAEALGQTKALTPMDLSLLRVGQRTGTLGSMFATIADYHEELLRDRLKRATLIIEQLAITLVATAIGAIVISLVSAMTSVYESIG